MEDDVQFNFPLSKKHIYTLNLENGFYELSKFPLGFFRLPETFKIEPTQKKEIVDSEYIIRGRKGVWDQKILTGLRRINTNWFYGDHFHKGKKNFLLFQIACHNKTIDVFYFSGFYPKGNLQRERLIYKFINDNNKTGEY